MKGKLSRLLLMMSAVALAGVLAVPAMALADSTADCSGECNHQAAIGSVHYDTLQEVVTAATASDEAVTLLQNVELSEGESVAVNDVKFEGDVTVVGAGGVIEFSGCTFGGDLVNRGGEGAIVRVVGCGFGEGS
ncbi:MAG: hypothetical protein IJO87_10340, partial [Eggerthellaceae bacterium]|nr:hypothetical protein [Eggerthellaceae bacterium]